MLDSSRLICSVPRNKIILTGFEAIPEQSSRYQVLRVTIIQSCYIPWKGFFDLIGRCDQYVMYDNAQFVKGHWHNRNRIKTATGTKWLTIPVKTSGRLGQPIREVEISEKWADRHWSAIKQAYKHAAHFAEHAELVRSWYEQADKAENLSQVNAIFLTGIASLLELPTRITTDAEYRFQGTASELVLAMVEATGGDRYLSGPSAQSYLDESIFAARGIAVEWMRYGPYKPYPQLHGDFIHEVSTLDVLFNTGPEAMSYVLPQSDIKSDIT